jgi:hypothetical protein
VVPNLVLCAVRSDKKQKQSPIIDFKEVFEQMADTMRPEDIAIPQDQPHEAALDAKQIELEEQKFI